MKKTALAGFFAFDAIRINSPPRIHRCEAGWSWSPAPLPDFDLWYVLDGVGDLQWGEVAYRLEPNSSFVFPPGAKIKARHDPKRRLRVFAVHFDLLDRDGQVVPARRVDLPLQGALVRDPVFFTTLARRCEASQRRGSLLGNLQSRLIVGQMLLSLWAESQQPVRVETDPRVNAAMELIQEDPGQRWTVSELAQRAGLSRSQFTRRFTATTGSSPEKFLIHSRIERATWLLHETDLTIGQIAGALGYCDIFHFSRQYRQLTGRTASSRRRRS